MEWTQFAIFSIGVFGCFFWNRSESRSDIRHMDAKLESNRSLIQAIHDEVKSFHNRMCDIERNKR